MQAAYCPYSGFSVGAALLAADGRVFSGCNQENAAYPAGICAERAAFAAAVTAGARKFSAIAIVGGRDGKPSGFCPPCGICRQVMNEFCEPDFTVLLWDGGEIRRRSLGELLPGAFGGKELCE